MRTIALGLLAAMSVGSAANAQATDPVVIPVIQVPADDAQPATLETACYRVVEEMQNERNIERAAMLTSMARSLYLGAYSFPYVATELEEQFQAAVELSRARRNWLRTFCADSLEAPPILPVQ